MSEPQKLRVAIVGGGIAGLSLAVALKSTKFHVDIYESAPELAEIGAGIHLWLRSWEIFKTIGIDEALAEFLAYYPNDTPRLVFTCRKSDQPSGILIKDLIMNGGPIRFHRADVQQTLIKHLPSNCRIHMGKRLVSYSETDNEVVLKFSDGTSASADLLVGADGVKSTVRKQLIYSLPGDTRYKESRTTPMWSGTIVYRGLIPMDLLEKAFPDHRARHTPVMYCGNNKHIVVYPVSQGRSVNVVAAHHDESKENTILEDASMKHVPQSEVLAEYAGWEPEVLALFKCIANPTKWPIQTLLPVSNYGKGRVLLLGDSAHAMLPHLGAGAGQGIEDAYILSSLLTNCNPRTWARIPEITKIYSTVRSPIGNSVQDGSQKQGQRLQLRAPGFTFDEPIYESGTNSNASSGSSELPRLRKLFDVVDESFRWFSESSPIGERNLALKMLRDLELKIAKL